MDVTKNLTWSNQTFACLIYRPDYMLVREKALLFWENGSPTSEWLQITEEDMVLTLPQNIEPLPVGGVQKRPPLVRSGSC